MRTRLLAAVLSLVAVQTPPALVTELGRVRGEVAGAVPGPQQTPILARLDRAQAALDRRRDYLALYLLESAYESSAAFAFAKDAGVTTPDAFLARWRAAGMPATPAAVSGRRPAVVEAIAAAADGRAPATYQASRPYAEDAGLDGGLYYLGESRALAAFALLARSLSWPDAGRRPAFRSIAAEIAALDAEMTAKYETMARADHPAYITASAALKQAKSLNDEGRYEAALFEYLLTRYLFAPLSGPAAAEATGARIAAARATLDPGVDHSLAELFLQLADEGVSGSVPAQRRGAAAALDDVLPAYYAAVAPPATTTSAVAPAAVTITLVRWPFT
jgi:hypothetical protein